MRTYILLFFFLLSFVAKADTISTWNVFYNSKLLKQYNANPSVKEINIKLAKYKSGDYLAIKYRDDMPCNDCKYELSVVTDAKWEVYWKKRSN